jgi:hypothetical protein
MKMMMPPKDNKAKIPPLTNDQVGHDPRMDRTGREVTFQRQRI